MCPRKYVSFQCRENNLHSCPTWTGGLSTPISGNSKKALSRCLYGVIFLSSDPELARALLWQAAFILLNRNIRSCTTAGARPWGVTSSQPDSCVPLPLSAGFILQSQGECTACNPWWSSLQVLLPPSESISYCYSVSYSLSVVSFLTHFLPAATGLLVTSY